MNVLVHDDLLATGGTAAAKVRLVQKMGGNVVGAAFLVELADLKGRDLLPGIEVASSTSPSGGGDPRADGGTGLGRRRRGRPSRRRREGRGAGGAPDPLTQTTEARGQDRLPGSRGP